jgi:tripartite ATP-independent transporter DctP family solute receptor
MQERKVRMNKSMRFLAVFALVAGMFAAGGRGVAAEEFTLTAGTNNDVTHPYYIGLTRMGEIMEERSGGRLKLTIFPSSQMGGERDMIEALQMGSLDITLVSTAPLSNYTDVFQVLDLPYIFRSYEHAFAVLDSDLGREMLDTLEDSGIIGLQFFENGLARLETPTLTTKPSEMAGRKIRSMENVMQVDAYNALGANGIAMAFSEVPTALQTGVLDALGLTYPTLWTMSFYTSVPYILETGHFYYSAPLLISKMTYDRLPADLQKIVRDAAAETRDFQRKYNHQYEYDMLQELLKNGVTHTTEFDRQAWIDAMVKPIYEKYVGEGKLIDPAVVARVEAMDPAAKK